MEYPPSVRPPDADQITLVGKSVPFQLEHDVE